MKGYHAGAPLSRGQVETCEADRLAFGEGDGQVVGPALGKNIGVHGGARRHEAQRPFIGWCSGLLGQGDLVPGGQQPVDGRTGRPGWDAAHGDVGGILLAPPGELDAERAGHDGRVVSEHLVELAHAVEHEVPRRCCAGGGMGEHHRAGVG